MYLCSHPPPQTVKADFGGEFKKDLEGFFANYGIQLDSSMPYSKGSTSAAESAISVVKGTLEVNEQLCALVPGWVTATVRVLLLV